MPVTVLAIVLCFALAVAVFWHFWSNNERRRAVRQYLVERAERLPPHYYNRELIRAFYTQLYSVPDNFLELSEPNFALDRLGWMLGMIDRLGPTATLNCSYLNPSAHPDQASYISSLEFWLDFELDGRRWAVWFRDSSFAVVDRFYFGRNYVSSTQHRRPHAEIASWLRRCGFPQPT